MSGPRARSRRHGASSGHSSSTTTSRVLWACVIGFSVLYLLSSHILVSRDDHIADKPVVHSHGKLIGGGGGGSGPGGDGPGGGVIGGGLRGQDDIPSDGGVPYEADPRIVAQDRPSGEQPPAEGPLDYVPLSCPDGEPDVDLSYWKNIPQDKKYESPWGATARKARDQGLPQYVTFEPDHGGFNNIRMNMETVLVFARETGRTLVMPPAQKFYLLQKPAAEFADMFPIEYLSDYMDVISMEEFLTKEGLTGHLGAKPPGDKISGHTKEELQDYLRLVADVMPHWNHMHEALVFGPSPENPAVPKDEESQAWLSWFLTKDRREMGYTTDLQYARHVHFKTAKGEGMEEYRLFTHFYTFLAFYDPVAARHHRRLVRDLVHFRESLFCASATIVGRLRAAGGGDPGRWSGYYGEWGGLGPEPGEVAGVGGPGYTSEGGLEEGAEGGRDRAGVRRRAGFSTYHIRRGDFQYAKMKPPAITIETVTAELLQPGEVLYIATDERDKGFFDIFRENHKVFFLDDFKDVLTGIDPSYYLMIDTIVASQGRTFIGTWRSTFTGYITRLRGYYRYPTEFNWYFWDRDRMDYYVTSLAKQSNPHSPFYSREWPDAWENIDQDIWP